MNRGNIISGPIISQNSRDATSIKYNWLCAIVVLSLLLQSLFLKMRLDDYIPSIGVIDEFVIVFCLYLFLKQYQVLNISSSLRFPVLFFMIYAIWSITITAFQSATLYTGLQQFFLDSKYVLIFFGCLIALHLRLKNFENIIKCIILINIPFVIFQALSPDVFAKLFPRGGDGLFALLSGVIIPRFSGFFDFAGILSTVSASSLCYFWFKDNTEKSNERFFYIVLACVYLVLTVSRAEMVSVLIAIFFCKMLSSKSSSLKFLTLISVAVLSFSVVFIFQDYFYFALVELGLIRYGYEDLAPRALFLKTSIEIANDYFPFGSGLGTFGGIIAVNNDSELFYKYLIAYEWYYQYGWFLTDTYWPKFIAESGYIGAALYLCFLIMHLYSLSKSQWVSQHAKNYTIAMLVFLLLTSLTSPVYSHVLTLFLTFSLLGYARK